MGRSGYVKPGNWKTTKRRILERDGFACYLCGAPAVTADHVLNVAAGGTHEDDNLAAICEPCHADKSERERRAGIAARKASRLPQHPGLISRGAYPGEGTPTGGPAPREAV